MHAIGLANLILSEMPVISANHNTRPNAEWIDVGDFVPPLVVAMHAVNLDKTCAQLPATAETTNYRSTANFLENRH